MTPNDYYERAQTRLGAGNNKGAIADFTKVIKLNPRHGMAYMLRGEAYHASSETDKAIADFTEAIKIGVPNRALAYGNRGSDLLAKGDYRNALENFNKAIGELDRKLAVLHLGRGTVYLEKGNTKKAEWELTCAMRLDNSLKYLKRMGLDGLNQAIKEMDSKPK